MPLSSDRNCASTHSLDAQHYLYPKTRSPSSHSTKARPSLTSWNKRQARQGTFRTPQVSSSTLRTTSTSAYGMSSTLPSYQASTTRPSQSYASSSRHGPGTPSSHRSRAHILTSRRRLKEYKDTVGLYIFTLDLITNNYPFITGVEGLPYDCFALTPCSTSTGGVVVLASNSVLFVDQSGRRVIMPVNGWPPRISDLPMPTLTPQEQTRDLLLEGSRFTFVDERTLFLFLRDGTVYPVELIQDGKTVSRLSMSPALAQTTIPAIVKRIGDDHVFVGSMVGPSVLLRTSQVEEEIVEEDVEMAPGPAVVDTANQMDMDDDEGQCSVVVCANSV